MNKIKVENNIISSDSTNINENTFITYINSDITLNFNITRDVRIFEYIDNSKLDITYNLSSSATIERFSLNSSVFTTINLDEENIKLDYNYSNINKDDNKYIINVNHNKKNTISNIVNHGINLHSNKLDYVINGLIKKDSSATICNQDSKIIIMEDNRASIKPNLIVDNNDITANHSAYIGCFNKENIFYLKSRGLNEEDCLKLLTKSFLIGKQNLSYLEKDLILKEIDDIWR